MARRLVERGVRMVQVYFGNGQPWDNHDDILIHRKLGADSPTGRSAALLQDLKQRGMLQETLVMIGGEFGRTPSVEVSGLVKVQNGRDHNNHGFTMLLAGGGDQRRHDLRRHRRVRLQGRREAGAHARLHATMLHLMGLDHTRLTYRYSGRDFRLTDVHGNGGEGHHRLTRIYAPLHRLRPARLGQRHARRATCCVIVTTLSISP